MMPRPSVDFPQPDSPTRPSTSPAPMWSDTPSTARTAPRGLPYQTRRLRSSRTGVSLTISTSASPTEALHGHSLNTAAPEHGVEDVVQALAEQGERRDEQHDRKARVEAVHQMPAPASEIARQLS